MSCGAYVDLRDLVRLRYQAQGFSYLPEQPVHSTLNGRKQSRLRGRGLDFDELRHYRPGDDIRHMDWKITRRTGTPYVRAYTEERDRPVWVVVDQRLSMFFGSRYQMKSVAAADIAALTAWRTIGTGDRIGAVLFNDHDCQLMSPSRSESTLMRWLQQLTTFNGALTADTPNQAKPSALANALDRLARRISHDGLVIVVSDWFGWDRQCLQTLKRIRRDNDVIATVVSDPLERDIGGARNLIVSDGKYQLHIDPLTAGADVRYREESLNRLALMSNDWRRIGIPMVAIDTASDAALQLKRKLGGSGPAGRARR